MDTAPDFSQLSDAELTKYISEAEASGPQETGSPGKQEPGVDPDELFRGLRPAVISRAADDVQFGQSLLERHLRHKGAFAAGRQPFGSDNPSADDLDFATWVRDQGYLKGEGQGLIAAAVDTGSAALAGTALLAKEVAVRDRVRRSGTEQEIADAKTRDTALSAEIVNQTFSLNKALAYGAARLTTKASAGVKEAYANLTNDPAFKEQIRADDDRNWYTFMRRMTVLGDEQKRVHDEAANMVAHAGGAPSELDAMATAGSFVADPGQFAVGAVGDAAGRGVKALVASAFSRPVAQLGAADGLRAEVRALAQEASNLEAEYVRYAKMGSEEAAAIADHLKDGLSAANAALGEKQRLLEGLDAANLDVLRSAGQASAPVKAAGAATAAVGGAVESAGNNLSALNQKVVDSVLNTIDAEADGTVAKAVKRAAPTAAVGAAIGATTNDNTGQGALEGAAAGAAIPSTLSNSGRLARILGENAMAARAEIPFLARMAVDREATGMEKWVFRKLDELTPAIDAGREAAKAVAHSAAVGAALGEVASGGEGEGVAESMGAAVGGHFAPSALIAHLPGIFRPVYSARERYNLAAGNLNVLKRAWEGTDNAGRLAKLSPTQQLEVASIAASNPDFTLRLIGPDTNVIKADQLARGETPGGFENTPGFHYKDPVTGRSVIVLNPQHPDSMRAVLAHEFWHKAQREGIAQPLVTEVIGDQELGVPGLFTKLDAEGKPVVGEGGKFELTDDFKAAKAEYESRLRAQGVDNPTLTDAEFAMEYGAEAGADFVLSAQFGETMRPTLGGLFANLMPDGVRNALGYAGTAFNADGKVHGSMQLGLKPSEGVQKLVREYTRKWSRGRNEVLPGEEGTPSVELTREQILKNPEVLNSFRGSSSINVTADGKIAGTRVDEKTGKLVIVDPEKAFKTAAQIAKEQAALTDHVLEVVREAPGRADGEVKIVTDGTGKEIATGRHFSDEQIARFEKQGKFNPYQLESIKNLNTLIKAGTGDYLRFFYQPASKGKKYATLAGHWREEVPYGWYVTKDQNLIFRTVSPDKVVQNLERLWTKHNERATELWSSQVSMVADAKTYLDNLSAGRTGDTGLGEGKRNFINLALGINTKERTTDNPLFSIADHKKLSSFITSRRIDRTNRLTAPERNQSLPWSYEAYSRGRFNRTAGMTQSNTVESSQGTGRPGIQGDMHQSVDAGAKVSEGSARDQRGQDASSVSEGGVLTDASARRLFHVAISDAAAGHPAGAAVTVKDPGFYADPSTKVFLAHTRDAGAAVSADGDLVSVFKAKGSKANIREVLAQASQHAEKLDAYTSGDGYLPKLYSEFGFRPAARIKFNREYAPEGWPYDKLGEPDVVFMVRDPKGVSGLPQVGGDYKAVEGKIPVAQDYDSAVAMQQAAIDTVKSAGKDRVQFTAGSGRMTEGEQEDLAQRASTRLPTAVKAKEDPLKQQLSITTKDVLADSAKATVIGNLLKKYPNLASKGKAADVINELHRTSVENLLWLHDMMAPELRERAKQWYDGGRKLVEQWSKEYNVPRQGVAGVLASLSPQKDWFMNVDLARRVIEHHAALKGKEMPEGVADWFIGKFGDKAPEKAQSVRDAVGKKYEDLSNYQKAVFVRAYDELNHNRGYKIIAPEGHFAGPAVNNDGKPSRVAWGDFGVIGKAIAILEDPSIATISDRLGQEHKVRNFYNNLLLPNNAEHGDVTIDTHAVAAALLRPLAGADTPVAHNFGGAGAPGSAITGASGLYGIYADAYREAAAKRGLLPREMQSITWEAIRALFTPEFKNAKNKAAVDAIWKQYKDGTITLDDARKQIHDLAGGIRTPSWAVSGAR